MGTVIWLTGISGSGKTTLAKSLKAKLAKKSVAAEVLDGDDVRAFFESDLGYSRRERIMNVKRIAFAAMLLARNGTNVIVANIAPYYEVRDFIRRKISNYIQIYLKTSVSKVMERDPKGHYRQAKEGKLKDLIGVDDAYDVPRRPDLIVETDKETVAESVLKIMNFLNGKLLKK